MDKIKNICQSLTPEELKTAVKEIAHLNETGILKEGIVRKTRQEIKNITNLREYPFEAVISDITWEISRRWFNGFYGILEGNIED